MLTIDLITKRVAIVTTIPIGSKIKAFWINAASKYIANDITATVIA